MRHLFFQHLNHPFLQNQHEFRGSENQFQSLNTMYGFTKIKFNGN